MGYQTGYVTGYGPDGFAGAVTFDGVGAFTVEASVTITFSGVGTFSATGGTEIELSVSFAATGSFSAAAAVLFTATAHFAGGTTFTATATPVAAVSFDATSSFVVAVPLDWRVDVVDRNGTLFGTLTNARIGRYSHELNATGAAEFSLPTTDPDAPLARPGREIQIYRNEILQWWGPIIRPQAGLHTTSWQCAGLMWYFDRRFMGQADRTNILTNGDFENGETSWSFLNGVGHSIDTGLFLEGSQSLLLTGAPADHIQYASQTSGPWAQSHPLGDYLTLAVWVYIPSSTYSGGALDDVGLVAVHRNSGGDIITVSVDGGELGDNTPKDRWIPLEVGVPAVMAGDTVEAQLYPPHGTAYFDLVTLTAMESLSTPYPNGEDIVDLIGRIVDYAQHGGGKSELNIGYAGFPTGKITHRAYQFAEHRNIADAIFEYVRSGYLDVGIETTPTTRTFRTYTPTRGSLFPTRLELDVNLADFTWSWDGETAASTAIILGPGDGPDRPEGGATVPGFLDGLTLELIESAPDDVTVGELDIAAAELLTVASDPQILEVTTLPHVGIIGNLHEGDTAHVVISRGWINIDAVYRAVRIEVDPYRDQATITLNPT